MLATTLPLAVCFIHVVVASSDNPGPYKKLGTTVVIKAGLGGEQVKTATWKHGADIALEWLGSEEPTVYREFKGRCNVNRVNGDLTIESVTKKDSGIYTPEINDRVRNATTIKIIAPVPKPTVTFVCNDDKTSCDLTCEGDIKDVEMVDYFWIYGDKNERGSKEFSITTERNEATFSCSLKNPVGHERSEEFPNPFLQEPPNPAAIIIPILVVALLAAILGVVGYKKRWCRKGTEETGGEENIEAGSPDSALVNASGTNETETNVEDESSAGENKALNGMKTSDPGNGTAGN